MLLKGDFFSWRFLCTYMAGAGFVSPSRLHAFSTRPSRLMCGYINRTKAGATDTRHEVSRPC